MTTTTELTDPFDQAVAEAMDELGEATPSDSLPTEPVEETEVLAAEEPDEEDGEHSTELEPPATEDSEDGPEDLFADLEIEEPEVEAEPEPEVSAELHELPGIDEPVTTEELRNGYLRQADYTRKTQEIAAEREANAKAVDFWQTLTSRPKDVARQLAEAAGLIEPGSEPVRAVDLPFRPAEDIQAEVDQKIEEALANHPDILAAQQVIGERWIESEFAKIEETHGVTLGPKSRELVLKTAQARKVDDLEMVFTALLAKQKEQARQRESLKQSAPAKPTGRATQQTVTEPPSTFEEAAAQAAAEKGIQLNLT